MGVLIKLGLATLFFGVAALTFLNPAIANDYLSTRYRGFYNYALQNSTFEGYFPSDIAVFMPISIYKAISLLIALGAVALLLDMKKIIIGYAFVVMIVGGLLHMPYTYEHLAGSVVSQVRKLICIFAIFFAMLLHAANIQDRPTARSVKSKPKLA